MAAKPQFSLHYLLAEVLMFGVAMGLTRWLLYWTPFSAARSLSSLSIFVELTALMLCWTTAAGFWGAAIGGLFGAMRIGARLAAYAVLLYFVVVTLFLGRS